MFAGKKQTNNVPFVAHRPAHEGVVSVSPQIMGFAVTVVPLNKALNPQVALGESNLRI